MDIVKRQREECVAREKSEELTFGDAKYYKKYNPQRSEKKEK